MKSSDGHNRRKIRQGKWIARQEKRGGIEPDISSVESMDGQIDIFEFESKIQPRNITAGDFDQIIGLQNKCSGGMEP